jgi:hypothetical protein
VKGHYERLFMTTRHDVRNKRPSLGARCRYGLSGFLITIIA